MAGSRQIRRRIEVYLLGVHVCNSMSHFMLSVVAYGSLKPQAVRAVSPLLRQQYSGFWSFLPPAISSHPKTENC